MSIQLPKALSFRVIIMTTLFLLCRRTRAFAGCESRPIGVENRYIIPDISFTASSSRGPSSQPSNSRLKTSLKGWSAKTVTNPNDYLQIDLGLPYVICAVATQGNSDDKNQWVTEYKINISLNNNTWTSYQENGQVKLFKGDNDHSNSVKHRINKAIVRYIRFIPTKYNTWKTMRVGLYGYIRACENVPLGMESGAIQDDSITASSAQYPAKNARLHYTSGSSWCASTSDSDPYLQIDLGSSHLICAVATQGNFMADQWVKTYQIDTSSDGTTWTTYQENNTDRVFYTNYDRTTVVRQVLYHGLVTRYLRIVPKTYQTGTPCLRTEIYGYLSNTSCSTHSVGIPSSSLVPDHRFTATSHAGSGYLPYKGRLGANSAWNPKTSNRVDDYLQVDLGAVFYICAVATQGTGYSHNSEWVTRYKLIYSRNGEVWTTYGVMGAEKELPGNTNTSTMVTNKILNPFKAKFVRILPIEFKSYKSMRVEFKGLATACTSPLGLENSQIPDFQITSSSSLDNSHEALRGRLYGSSSWCSSTNSNIEYIQVDLGQVKTVTGIATQGNPTINAWVTSYKVSYSFDNTHWSEYKEGQVAKIFEANFNKNNVKVNWLRPPIAALYVRVNPQNSSGQHCLRFDLYGCAYHTPEAPSNQAIAEKRSSLLRWTNTRTSHSKAENFLIELHSTNGLIKTCQLQNHLINSFNIADLKPYTKYEIKMTALKKDGRPLWTSTTKVMTLIAEPEGVPLVTGIQATSSQNISIVIKFSQSNLLHGPMAGFRIFYKPEGGSQQQIDVGNVSKATLTDLTKYNEYSLSVAVRNTMYVGPGSAVTTIRTLEDVPDIGPRNTSATKINDTVFLITWQALTTAQSNGLITKYEIFWSFSVIGRRSRKSLKETLNATTQATQYNLYNLKVCVNYTVSVRGYTRVGPGPRSTVEISARAQSAGKPNNVRALEQSTSIELTWKKPSPKSQVIKKYMVKVEAAKKYLPHYKFSKFYTQNGRQTSLVIKGLRPGTSYEFWVMATTECGQSKKSARVIATTKSVTLPEYSNSTLWVKEGDELTIGCHAGGNDTIAYTWTKSGSQIDDNADIKLNGIILTVKPKTDNDFGNYVCTATNTERTVVYKITRVELKKYPTCTSQASKLSEDKTNEVVTYVIPLVLVILGLIFCIVFMAYRQRKEKQCSCKRNNKKRGDRTNEMGITNDVMHHLDFKNKIITNSRKPGTTKADKTETSALYMELQPRQSRDAIYQSIQEPEYRHGNSEGHTQGMMGHEQYMDLKPIVNTEYETLNYKKNTPGPDYENVDKLS